MATGIESVAVAEDRYSALYGLQFHDYRLDGVSVDLQDLAVKVAQQRAASIENEVLPLEAIITRRNDRLEKYGKVLSSLTELQASFTDSSTGERTIQLSIDGVSEEELKKIFDDLGYSSAYADGMVRMTKSQTDGAVQMAKSKIDTMNNESQKDMTRLQSVVDRRDESYSTATSLMTDISDTRGSLIHNL